MYFIYVFALFFLFVLLYLLYLFLTSDKKSKDNEKAIKKIKNEYDLESEKSFDENFYGIANDPSVIKARIKEILKGIKEKKSFYLNVVEAYYLLEHFGDRILKSETGKYYLIDEMAAQKFLHSLTSGQINEFLRDLKKIEKKLMQKNDDGRFRVNAKDLFYRIRMGHVDGNKSKRFIGFSAYQFSEDAKFVIIEPDAIDKLKTEQKEDKLSEGFDLFKKNGDKDFLELKDGSRVFLTNEGVVVEKEHNQEKRDGNPLADAAREMREAVNQIQRLILQPTMNTGVYDSDISYDNLEAPNKNGNALAAKNSESFMEAKTPVEPPALKHGNEAIVSLEQVAIKRFGSLKDVYKCAAKRSCMVELLQKIVDFSAKKNFPHIFAYGNGVIYISTLSIAASIFNIVEGKEKEEIFSVKTGIFDSKSAARILRRIQDETKKHSSGLFYPDDLKPIFASIYLKEKCYFAKYLVINKSIMSALPHSVRKKIENAAATPKKVVLNSSIADCLKSSVEELFSASSLKN